MCPGMERMPCGCWLAKGGQETGPVPWLRVCRLQSVHVSLNPSPVTWPSYLVPPGLNYTHRKIQIILAFICKRWWWCRWWWLRWWWWWHFHARPCSESFHILTRPILSDSLRWILLLFPIDRWGNWDPGRLVHRQRRLKPGCGLLPASAFSYHVVLDFPSVWDLEVLVIPSPQWP